MKIKPLIQTNIYLRDKALRKKQNAQHVHSSCGVEGIQFTTNKITAQIKRRNKKLFKKLKAKFSSN